MRLIERAMRDAGQPAASSAKVETGDGVGVNGYAAAPDVPVATAVPPCTRAAQRFKLDSRSLARQGFITPATLSSQLGREIGNIRRRLLRRLDFFNRPAVGDSTHGHRGRNVVLVTSSKPNDGKTFTAVNLALSVVLEDEINVLLIDADVYTSKIGKIFGLEATYGLSEHLQSPDLPLAECLFKEEKLPLVVLPAGKRPRAAASLFGEQEMVALMREVATRYPDRLVIIDGPPLLATTEAPVLVPYADEVVLVVRSGDANQDLIGSALDALGDTDKISLVLNRSPIADVEASYSPYQNPYYQAARS